MLEGTVIGILCIVRLELPYAAKSLIIIIIIIIHCLKHAWNVKNTSGFSKHLPSGFCYNFKTLVCL